MKRLDGTVMGDHPCLFSEYVRRTPLSPSKSEAGLAWQVPGHLHLEVADVMACEHTATPRMEEREG